MLEMRLATMDDFATVSALFDDVMAQQAHDAYSPRWTPGVYPSEEDLRGRIEAGELYLGFDGDRAVATVTLAREEDPEYYGTPWPSGAGNDEVAVIHLLAVHPSARGRGLGAEVARWCAETARAWGKRAIHLDVVPGNLAASRIYTAIGFELACHHLVHYEDLGDVSLEMYELVL